MKAIGYKKNLPATDVNSLQDIEIVMPKATGKDILVEVKKNKTLVFNISSFKNATIVKRLKYNKTVIALIVDFFGHQLFVIDMLLYILKKI